MRQDPSDVRVTMQCARKRQIEHGSGRVGKKLKERGGKFQSELAARRRKIAVNDSDGFAPMEVLHERFKLRIAEETVSHASHENEPVALERIQRICGLSNRVINCWERNTREKAEAIRMFANQSRRIFVTAAREVSGKSRITEINPRRRDENNSGLDSRP